MLVHNMSHSRRARWESFQWTWFVQNCPFELPPPATNDTELDLRWRSEERFHRIGAEFHEKSLVHFVDLPDGEHLFTVSSPVSPFSESHPTTSWALDGAQFCRARTVFTSTEASCKLLENALTTILPAFASSGILIRTATEEYWETILHLRARTILRVTKTTVLQQNLPQLRPNAWRVFYAVKDHRTRRRVACRVQSFTEHERTQLAHEIAATPQLSFLPGEHGEYLCEALRYYAAAEKVAPDSREIRKARCRVRYATLWHVYHHRCWRCLRLGDGEAFKVCGGCKIVKYCSRRCQKKDWSSEHRNVCSVEFQTQVPDGHRLLRLRV